MKMIKTLMLAGLCTITASAFVGQTVYAAGTKVEKKQKDQKKVPEKTEEKGEAPQPQQQP